VIDSKKIDDKYAAVVLRSEKATLNNAVVDGNCELVKHLIKLISDNCERRLKEMQDASSQMFNCNYTLTN
jgi:hypothetical protein